MPLLTESYQEQTQIWPADGRHILAQFDDESIVLYQAYTPAIGHFAAANGVLGGPFRYTRMSWVKPNFLWMMFRSGWGTKPNQEVTLSLRVRRTFFDALLGEAVPSTWNHDLHPSREAWSQEVERSDVRLQWDPDHHPSGAKLERRAIQLGLRGLTLEAFGQRELLEVQDISEFVAEQRHALASRGVTALQTPRERVYRPADPAIAARIRLADLP
ncbi:DUF4291 domain-containing protein [Planctomyces sp. SH-PL14]|uniref:DUF4291 domain-containing protein n=1 Tax=Planctomyces sp. SH-PL14 TaxID=1632864 RepID=UPI00078D2406|nr:DUF4291 domain-containing protein [Planctomyces sp. SH-PL14]AMV17967.1 hypothetical protein VT03_08765 [Planctomyces sp. SH-PL14]